MTATFRDLTAFCRVKGLRTPGRAVGGPLRGWYLRHPERVRVVRGRAIEPKPLWEGPVHFHLRDCEDRGKR